MSSKKLSWVELYTKGTCKFTLVSGKGGTHSLPFYHIAGYLKVHLNKDQSCVNQFSGFSCPKFPNYPSSKVNISPF